MNSLRQLWNRLADRERRMLEVAVWALGLAGVWWLLIAPALDTVRTAPARHAQLDTIIQTMRSMQSEAQSLAVRDTLPADETRRQLEQSAQQHLGPATQISSAGNRATITVKGASPDAFAQWLAQARSNARSLPLEIHLTRGATGLEGSVVMGLP